MAFGGRTLKKDDKAKYINSPESEIYKKSNELYGLYQAKSAITREDKVFLVEGYMDVIGMWQSGMQNVVASSGTALTDGQIALIHRFTSKVTLLYDGDSAGIKAALRGINMLLEHSMDVSVLLLPEGHDPDSFARAHTPEEFRKYVQENETDIVRFKIRILLEHCRDNPQKRAAAIRSVVESIACIPDNITRNVYIGECARLFGVDENMIAVETRRAREGAVSRARQQRDRAKIQAMEQSAAAQQQQQHQQQPQVSGGVPAAQQAPQEPAMPVRLSPLQKRLLSCEKETLRYCVKYGRLDFSEGIDEDGNSVRLNVLDFVRCELEADGLSFSHAPYGEVFHRLEGLTEDFEEAYRQYAEEVDRELTEKRRKGYEEIGKEHIEMAELQSREKILENNLAAERERALVDFVTLWPGRQLASDEDDNVRAIVTELITAKYHISRVYTEAGYVDDERTRLEELVARAVDEWKDTILEIRQNELRQKLTAAAAEGDMEGVMALQKELVELTSLRSSVAKYIGDRVIVSR